MDFANSFFFELQFIKASAWSYAVFFTALGAVMNFAFYITGKSFKKHISIMLIIWAVTHIYGYFFFVAPGESTSWLPVILGVYPAILFFYMITGFAFAQLLKNIKENNTK